MLARREPRAHIADAHHAFLRVYPSMLRPRVLRRAALGGALLALAVPARGLRAQGTTESPYRQLGREILQQLIETNTTHATGNTTVAAEALAARFRDVGFPAADVQVVGPSERNRNLVVRYRGTGAAKPVLLLAHLDVVDAKREDWSVDPFTLLERDGWFYGRGTLDVKGGAATLVASLLRLEREGWTPDRDLILALTAGEESGADYNGVSWLLANHRDLIDAAYCINVDAGGPELRGGKPVTLDVQASEKVYQSFTWTVHNPGGHSSLPRKDNAIYRLAGALERWSRVELPMRLTEVTRAYFAGMAPVIGGRVGADMRAIAREPMDATAARRLASSSAFYNALLRTTCVATELQGGHAENALPQTARAVVNCRLLPGDDPRAVRRRMVSVVADTAVVIDTINSSVPSPPSPLTPQLLGVIERAARSMWGNVPVVPYMETGATDGLFLRNAGMPVYGVGTIGYDPNDVRAHGRDERIAVQAYDDGLEFAYRLLRGIAGAPTQP